MNGDLMEKEAVIIFMGSEKDRSVAERIIGFWKKNSFPIKFESRVLSAHKVALSVIEAIKEYEKEFDSIVFIAIAGRSNALGPLIAGHSRFPVINCPVLSEKFNFMDLLSSLRMPSNTACSTILEPENAALHAIKILSLSNQALKKRLEEYFSLIKKELQEKDSLARQDFKEVH